MQDRNSLITFFIVSILFIFAPINILAQRQVVQNRAGKTIRNKQVLVSEVIFEGLDPYYEYDEINSEDSLYERYVERMFRENKVKFKEKTFSSEEIERAMSLLKEWLFSKGFVNANITVLSKPDTDVDDSIIIIFSIERGEKTRVAKIQFVGNKIFTNEELVESLKQCLGDAWKTFDKGHYEYCSRKGVVSFLHSKGYLNTTIQKPKARFIDNNFSVNFQIKEGIRYRIGQVKITDATAFSNEEILKMLGLKTGDIANGKNLRDSLYENGLKKAYAEKGFIQYDVDYVPDLVEPQNDESDGTANLSINVIEGRAFKLLEIDFLNVDKQTSQFLRQFINIKDGQIFNQNTLEDGIKKINESNQFAPLDLYKDVEIRTDDEGDLIQVLIKVRKN